MFFFCFFVVNLPNICFSIFIYKYLHTNNICMWQFSIFSFLLYHVSMFLGNAINLTYTSIFLLLPPLQQMSFNLPLFLNSSIYCALLTPDGRIDGWTDLLWTMMTRRAAGEALQLPTSTSSASVRVLIPCWWCCCYCCFSRSCSCLCCSIYYSTPLPMLSFAFQSYDCHAVTVVVTVGYASLFVVFIGTSCNANVIQFTSMFVRCMNIHIYLYMCISCLLCLLICIR